MAEGDAPNSVEHEVGGRDDCESAAHERDSYIPPDFRPALDERLGDCSFDEAAVALHYRSARRQQFGERRIEQWVDREASGERICDGLACRAHEVVATLNRILALGAVMRLDGHVISPSRLMTCSKDHKKSDASSNHRSYS
ncbi:MAG TPA: hypothetical protein VIF40_18945 [Methylosinus sp.]|uniref:hypothetical protein n=1 Tax=Methylosinus sp. TaxID=427 RepID=UPI002F95AE33